MKHEFNADKKIFDQFVAELNSGYGDNSSFIEPYKEIMSIGIGYYNAQEGKMWAMVDVHACQQSPYGDSANTRQSFKMTKDQIRVLEGKLLNGDFKIENDEALNLAITGLNNVIDVLDRETADRTMNPDTLPDIDRVNAHARRTRDLPMIEMLAGIAHKIK